MQQLHISMIKDFPVSRTLEHNFPCGIPDPRWKSTCSLPPHSRCLTGRLFTLLPLHPFILNPSTGLLPRGWVIYKVRPLGCHFSSWTCRRCCFRSLSVLCPSVTWGWGAALLLFEGKFKKLFTSFVHLFNCILTKQMNEIQTQMFLSRPK